MLGFKLKKLFSVYKLKKNRVVILVLILIAINSTIWNIVIPIWQTPDELSHFSYAQGIIEHKHIPILNRSVVIVSKESKLSGDILKFDEIPFDQSAKFLFDNFEESELLLEEYKNHRGEVDVYIESAGNYPPLYYIISSIPYAIFRYKSLTTCVHSMRFISTLLLVITCLFTYQMAKLLNFSKTIQIAICLFIGFQPMLSMLSASINPDNLVITLFGIFFYFLVKNRKDIRSIRVSNLYLLITITFFTILTKEYSIIMLIFFLIYLFFLHVNKRGYKKYFLKDYIPIYILTILLIILQYRVLISDPGLGKLISTKNDTLLDFCTFLINKDYVFGRLSIFYFKSFWAVFGWLDTSVSSIYYYIFLFFTLLVFLGIFSEIVIFKRRRRLFLLASSCVFALFLFLLFLEYRINKLTGSRIIQGRYFLVMITPIAL